MSLEAAAVTIRGLLFADVFANLLQLETHCGHRVSTGPEVLAREIPLFATQAGHGYGALPSQKSDHRGHRILRRNRDVTSSFFYHCLPCREPRKHELQRFACLKA